MAGQDLGRVDWMSRLKKWRAIKYVGTKDITIDDFDTKPEAEDALRSYVDQQSRSERGETPMGQDIDEMLRQFKASTGLDFNTSKLEDYMKSAQGSAMLCKMPSVLKDFSDFTSLAYLTGEGLEHLDVPSDRAVQQLIDAFTKDISEILVDDCGCAHRTERKA